MSYLKSYPFTFLRTSLIINIVQVIIIIIIFIVPPVHQDNQEILTPVKSNFKMS